MKKYSFFVLFMVLIALIFNPNSSYASSSGNTSIVLNGNKMNTSNVADVQNINGTIMIPLRVVAENLKYEVTWNQKVKTVEIKDQNKSMLLTVGSKNALVDGKIYKLSIAPQISKSTALVPLRFVGEEMGLKVSWNNANKTVSLFSLEQDDSNLTSNTNNNHKDDGYISNISFVNNQLTVKQTKSVQPSISTLSNPNRIVVDIPNMVLNESIQSGQSMETVDVSGQATITEIRYSQFSTNPSTVRIVIETENSLDYSLDLSDSSMMKLNFSTNDSSNSNSDIASSKKIIIIDPGHGGKDPGAVSINNRFEKNFTLPVSLKVRDLLEKESNIEVVMTREDDVYPTLNDRSDLANKYNADIFISIHGNKVKAAPKANGTETYYYKSAKGKELASVIHKNLIKALGLKDRGVKEANYHVLRETNMPAALLEIGFLSNYSDEKLMFTDSFQNKAAQAIVKGIIEFMN